MFYLYSILGVLDHLVADHLVGDEAGDGVI